MNLTPEQKLFAEHPNEVFVEACPGAGKTRTILSRLAHIATSLPPRRGIAVLSFTNKAIEEFKTRSAITGIGSLLRHPGFIGTFDSFVRHFLFIPVGVQGNAMKPQVVDSWETLGIEIRLRGTNAFAGPGVSLDLFNPETNAIDPNRISHVGLKKHIISHRADYERAAQQRRQNLNQQGYFSVNDARIITLQRIHQPEWGQALGRAIAGRFQEIVVDEAQDCNPLDLEVLTWLRSHGIRVTMVCDMDQSIYAFRDGDRTHLEAFANTYAPENRLNLTGNFRSSPAICSLAASLRSKPDADTPLGLTKEITDPIAIYAYRGRSVTANIGQWFISLTENTPFSIPRAKLIILAHGERAACLASGSFSTPVEGQSKIEQLARALSEFWTGTTQHSKGTALSSIEKLLLDITGQRNDCESVPRTVERLGLDARLLRRQALEIATHLPKTCLDTPTDRSAWIASTRNLIQELGLILPSGQTIKTALRSPVNNNWLRHLKQADTDKKLQYATIHNAKGGEYEGVCVVIPPDDTRVFTTKLINAWATRSDDESKRVIYVGVTRAMRLAALAIPAVFLDQCVSILTQAIVPFQTYNQ